MYQPAKSNILLYWLADDVVGPYNDANDAVKWVNYYRMLDTNVRSEAQ